jgi:hypothetical protein
MEGVDAALKKRGYPSIDDLKIGRKRRSLGHRMFQFRPSVY